MHGSVSRARMNDPHSASVRSLGPPHVHSHTFSTSTLLSAHSGTGGDVHPLDHLHPSVALHASGGGHKPQFRSLGVACEIQLKEAIEKSRVADRILRAPPPPTVPASAGSAVRPAQSGVDGLDHRSATEGLVDRSISSLALTVFSILQAVRGSFPSAALHTQLVAVLDQLIWSSTTRLVAIPPAPPLPGSTESGELSARKGATSSASSASLHSQSPSQSHLLSSPRLPAVAGASPSPSASPSASSRSLSSLLPVLERVTNYELGLLHARNDSSWRSEYASLSARESALSSEVASLRQRNEMLESDLATAVERDRALQARSRELERSIHSLDHRLAIQSDSLSSLESKCSALQAQLLERSEELLRSQTELKNTRRELQSLHRPEALIAERVEAATESLRADLIKEREKGNRVKEHLSSINRLYYASMATAHDSIQKREALQAELDEAQQRIAALSVTRDEMLRPYTPRPSWSRLYRSHVCELTPTLLLDVSRPTLQQVEQVLEHLVGKDRELAVLQRALEQGLEVQAQAKREHARLKREVEQAQRAIMAAQNRLRSGGGGSSGYGGGYGGGGGGAGGFSSSSLTNGRAEDPLDQSLTTTTTAGGAASFTPATLRTGKLLLPLLDPKSRGRFFLPLGSSPLVPAFLRSAVRVKHRHLAHKDCLGLVREVWARKRLHDAERARLDLSLPDFFYAFLKNKYGLTNLVSEWGYNTLDALVRFKFDGEVEMFLGVLDGSLAEEAYYDQILLVQTVTNIFMALEVVRADRAAAAARAATTAGLLGQTININNSNTNTSANANTSPSAAAAATAAASTTATLPTSTTAVTSSSSSSLSLLSPSNVPVASSASSSSSLALLSPGSNGGLATPASSPASASAASALSASATTLPLDYISRVLRLVFPLKPRQSFDAIIAALQSSFAECPAAQQDYSLLFAPSTRNHIGGGGGGGGETNFMDEVRDQHYAEITGFQANFRSSMAEITPLTDEEIKENGGDDEGEERKTQARTASSSEGADTPPSSDVRVRLYSVHHAWVRLDPLVTVERMDFLIARALRLPLPPPPAPQVLDPSLILKVDLFCDALFSSGLINYTNNFCADAPTKLLSIPVPGASNDVTTVAANAALVSMGVRNRRGTLVKTDFAALMGDTAAAAATEGGTSITPTAAVSLLSPPPKSSSTPLHSALSVPIPKVQSLLTSPRLMRLRPRFGLDPTPGDPLLFLERGPAFVDPAAAAAGLAGPLTDEGVGAEQQTPDKSALYRAERRALHRELASGGSGSGSGGHTQQQRSGSLSARRATVAVHGRTSMIVRRRGGSLADALAAAAAAGGAGGSGTNGPASPTRQRLFRANSVLGHTSDDVAGLPLPSPSSHSFGHKSIASTPRASHAPADRPVGGGHGPRLRLSVSDSSSALIGSTTMVVPVMTSEESVGDAISPEDEEVGGITEAKEEEEEEAEAEGEEEKEHAPRTPQAPPKNPSPSPPNTLDSPPHVKPSPPQRGESPGPPASSHSHSQADSVSPAKPSPPPQTVSRGDEEESPAPASITTTSATAVPPTPRGVVIPMLTLPVSTTPADTPVAASTSAALSASAPAAAGVSAVLAAGGTQPPYVSSFFAAPPVHADNAIVAQALPYSVLTAATASAAATTTTRTTTPAHSSRPSVPPQPLQPRSPPKSSGGASSQRPTRAMNKKRGNVQAQQSSASVGDSDEA